MKCFRIEIVYFVRNVILMRFYHDFKVTNKTIIKRTDAIKKRSVQTEIQIVSGFSPMSGKDQLM